MPEKEIMIHGVNVKDCEYFRWFDSKCSLIHCPYGGHPSCENIPNCQYKRLTEQLQSKTAELLKLQESIRAELPTYQQCIETAREDILQDC